ncbi:methyl-accepting chemotaxis protein [Halalkalibacter urbisdiaboli]|uniref:methyl-accepting chemotaxis protein n=1 Tax=Halalkalibacter urbisdiaboli TaxID=1960589 RepID=UPI000B452A70|nr:methyl-accepting chemotaxis protein [Halalkalibacter urbisdiaboli]
MKLTIKTKLTFFSLLLLTIPIITIGIINYQSSKDALDDSGRNELKTSIRMSIELIESLDKLVQTGEISLEDAQEIAKSQLLGPKAADGSRPINENIKIGESGYPFVIDEEGLLLAHPSSEGNNIWDSEDPNGVKVGKSIVEAALNGDGYSYYKWPLPSDPDTIALKVTYAEVDPYWGWILSYGTYMQDFNSKADEIFTEILVILGLSLIVGIGVTLLFAKKLADPITKLSLQVKEVANGNLTVKPLEITTKDEVGKLTQDFNTMTSTLRSTMEKVSASAQQVAATSEELNSGAEENSKTIEHITNAIQEVAAGTEQQSESFKNSVQFVNRISEDTHVISQQANIVFEASKQASLSSDKGEDIITQLISQMDHITDSTRDISSIINELNTKSLEIGKIISLITAISDQTNLLALNAAIEAARAGDHGKGFAVVAEEVRKLAEQSNDSALQIQNLIKEIQEKTDTAVDSMKNGELTVSEGKNLVDQAGTSFKDISLSVDEVSKRMVEVTDSVEKINDEMTRLKHSMNDMNDISEQNSGYSQNVAASIEQQNASTQEVTAFSETLAKMAEELANTVKQFKI